MIHPNFSLPVPTSRSNFPHPPSPTPFPFPLGFTRNVDNYVLPPSPYPFPLPLGFTRNVDNYVWVHAFSYYVMLTIMLPVPTFPLFPFSLLGILG